MYPKRNCISVYLCPYSTCSLCLVPFSPLVPVFYPHHSGLSRHLFTLLPLAHLYSPLCNTLKPDPNFYATPLFPPTTPALEEHKSHALPNLAITWGNKASVILFYFSALTFHSLSPEYSKMNETYPFVCPFICPSLSLSQRQPCAKPGFPTSFFLPVT